MHDGDYGPGGGECQAFTEAWGAGRPLTDEEVVKFAEELGSRIERQVDWYRTKHVLVFWGDDWAH